MFQSMTGQIVPSFFTKGATKDELEDSATRHKITMDIADFLINNLPYELDDEGYMKVDLVDELLDISHMADE